ETPLDFFIRDLVEPLSFEVEVLVEQAAVATGCAWPVLLLAFRDVQITGGVPGDRARTPLPERPLGEQTLGLGPGLRERNARGPADGGEPTIGAVLHHKGRGATLRDPAAEARQALVKVSPLALLGTGQISYTDVGQSHDLSLALASRMMR